MNTLTKEEVQAVLDLKAGYTLGHADMTILHSLARIALASMDAKPIGQVVEIGPVFIADFYGQVTRGDKLYAAPPAPVGLINDAYLESIIKEQEANLKAAEYELKKNAPQPTPESADRRMLKRLAVIMSGSDSGGEISALTVTAQSLVDRCKALACGKEKLAATESLALGVKCPFPYGWEELKRRTNQDTLFFSAYMVEGEEVTDLHRDIVDRMVDRLLKVIAACQTDASYSGPTTWNPASLEEVNKRSVREHEQQHTSTFPPAKGPQIPPIPPSQAVHIALYSPKLPVEVLAAVKEVVRIRLDFNDFDGDRRGIGECLERAEQKLIEIINKNAALLDKEIA